MERKQGAKTGYKKLLAAVIALIVAVVLSVTVLFAWFSDARNAYVKDTPLQVIGEKVTLGDTITVTRSVLNLSLEVVDEQTFEYKRENGQYGRYNLTENGAPVMDTDGNPVRLAVPSFGFLETVTIKMTVEIEHVKALRVYFGNVAGEILTKGDSTFDTLSLFTARGYLVGDNIPQYESLGSGEHAFKIDPFETEMTGTYEIRIDMMVSMDALYAIPAGFALGDILGHGLSIGSLGVCAA